MVKQSLQDSSSTIQSISDGDKKVHAFPKDMGPKVKKIERQEFELGFYYIAVQHVNLYTTKIPSLWIGACLTNNVLYKVPRSTVGWFGI